MTDPTATDPTPPALPPHARGYDGFTGQVGRVFAESRPGWPAEKRAMGPNIVVVLVDDLGYADIGPFGGEIATPALDALAAGGLRLTNYHTTPLCSPSRAALLTGLNPHRAGFAFPANSDPGYPAYSFQLPDNAPSLAESLRGAGYATFAVGKWHLTRDAASHDAADRSSWPLQRGFDRYFGSLEGLTNLHHPHRLVWDNSPYDGDFPEGYYLTDDLTDRATRMIDTLRASDPDKPFFLYFAHHAMHGPLGAKDSDLQRYRGRYAEGWDAIREKRFAKQLAEGLFPAGTALPPRNSEPGKDVPPWDELTVEQQELFARYMEVYAASLDNVDQSVGRIVETLRKHGELDNTIIVFTSDNGATAEGGPAGTRSYFSQFVHVPGVPSTWERDVERELDLLGGPQTTIHYPRGWAQASNTPFRLYKFDTYAGGVRTPFIVHWPAGLEAGLRHQYVYVTDVTPTLLELAGVPRLADRHGVASAEEDGVSAVPVLRDPAVESPHTTQYTETGGNRGYYADGWKIVTRHIPGKPFDDSEWELYHVATDPTETTNVAAEHPEKLAELAAAWEHAAWNNAVFPLNDYTPANDLRRPADERLERPVTLYPGTPLLERYRSAQLVQFRDFVVEATVDGVPGEGVLFSHGDQGGGYVVYLEGGAAHLTYNAYGAVHRSGPVPLDGGPIRLSATALPDFQWSFVLATDSGSAEVGPVAQLIGLAPFTGISVGADRGGPVDWDLHTRAGTFPYTGTLRHVRYEPGAQADYDPKLIARLWAEAERVYD
ncbi:arylsulfatase [Actinokineospora globicatena]|uniref:arylsulfatase n=1 Tax=Actinokineospora globicatena TaxID=103729 RepID=UPI0020A2C067|nr:arylsulfatase [Actinokineospora globicatena]MCP2305833.1 arylsulfatase [Actinokineospora globicatena]GLW80302.1 arylsulfatase [Actinokineospora globicatena]GLW87130.1 arylsulfatase [Actinokineospora globicatena]